MFTYLCTAHLRPRRPTPASAGTMPTLAIDWPVGAPLLSDKDAKAPFLADVAERPAADVYAP